MIVITRFGYKHVWAQTCVGTNVCGHKRVWAQTCVGANVCGHKRVWAQSCVGTNVCEHKRVWAQTCVGTKVCGHKRVWAQSCLGTNVCGHNRVWAQSCVGTIVSGHKRVWAQTCLGTIVCGHNCVWAQSCLGTIVWAQSCMGPIVWSPWYSPMTDHRGTLIADKINNSDHLTLNTDSHTRHPTNRNQQPTSPDISTATNTIHNNITWTTLDAINSDHKPIAILYKTKTKFRLTQNRLSYTNYKKADWTNFTRQIEGLINANDIQTYTQATKY